MENYFIFLSFIINTENYFFLFLSHKHHIRIPTHRFDLFYWLSFRLAHKTISIQFFAIEMFVLLGAFSCLFYLFKIAICLLLTKWSPSKDLNSLKIALPLFTTFFPQDQILFVNKFWKCFCQCSSIQNNLYCSVCCVLYAAPHI